MSKATIILVLMFTSVSFSQVGIGNTNPKSTLDISASNPSTPSNTDGLLIPRIAAFPTVNPTVDQQGMLVYLTIVAGTNSPGFYYWNNPTTTWVNIDSDIKTYLEDADADTKIQVEESADEDLVRFDIAGTEYFRMEAGRIQVSNTNNNVFYGNDAGDITATGGRNTAFGTDPLNDLTTGGQNVAIGDRPLHKLTTGNNNIGIGSRTMNNKISGDYNVVLGRDAMRLNTTGSNNIIMGLLALSENLTGSSNVAIGSYAGRGNLGDKSVFIGNAAGANETDSSRLYIDNSNTASPLIYGEFDNNLLRVNGTLDVNNAYQLPTADGTMGQVLATDGAGTIAWSTTIANAIIQDTDGDTKIQVEESADEDIIRFDLAGTEYFRMENGRLEIENTGGSVIIGKGAGISDDFTSNSNVIVGDFAARGLTTGAQNIAVGRNALQTATVGNDNIAIGSNAARNQPSGEDNVFIGSTSGVNASTTNNNVAIGIATLANVASNNNVALGTNSLTNLTTGANNIGLGYQSASSMNTGSNNLALGHNALQSNETGSYNNAIGFGALQNNLDGWDNAVIGRNSLFSNVNGFNNVVMGYEAGFNNLGSYNVFLGSNAGYNEVGSNKLYIDNNNTPSPLIYGEFNNDLLRVNGTLDINNAYQFPTADGTTGQVLATDGAGNIIWNTPDANNILEDADGDTKIQVEESADEDMIRFDLAGTEYFRMENGRLEIENTGGSVIIGKGAGISDDFSDRDNVLIGNQSGAGLINGSRNVALGNSALNSSETGFKNVAIGNNAASGHISGNENVFIGAESGWNAGSTNNNVALGVGTLQTVASGENVALGSYALQALTTGDKNIGIGAQNQTNLDTGTQNVSIGFQSQFFNTSGSYNITMGNQSLADNTSGSNNVAIGPNAGRKNLGSGSVFLGFNSGGNEIGSNKLYIDNSTTASPLIYGEFDNDLLRVNGTLDINNAYQLPIADGTSGQVLSTDGSGNAVWSDTNVEAETTTIAFEANWSQYGGAWEQVTYYKDRDRVYIDGLANKNTTIGTSNDHIFTLPVGYRPAGKVIASGHQSDNVLRVEIHSDGRVFARDSSGASTLNYISLSGISFRVN